MTLSAVPRRGAKPRGFTFVVVLMFVQAAFNVFFAVLLLASLNDALDHGQTVENPGLVRFALLLSFAAAAAQLLCGFLLPRRVPWARQLAIGVELVTIGSAVLAFVNNGVPPQAISGIALPVLALVYLLNREMTEWFARR